MLLADESVNKNIIIAMRNNGYYVFSVMEEMRSEDDINIAKFSLEPLRIIVTEDKDFGEIVYHHNLKVAGIILLRYSPLDYKIIENKLLNYLSAHLEDNVGKFDVINSKLTRVRHLPF